MVLQDSTLLQAETPLVFFHATAPTAIYTLSLHDALPIGAQQPRPPVLAVHPGGHHVGVGGADRKSTRLNSSHSSISYAVFCLKKKNAPDAPLGPVLVLDPCP